MKAKLRPDPEARLSTIRNLGPRRDLDRSIDQSALILAARLRPAEDG